MLKTVTGDMWAYDADVRVNAVNCQGVMGAGVARQFKEGYPAMFEAYRWACAKRQLQPGSLHVWYRDKVVGPPIQRDVFVPEPAKLRAIVNLPTKNRYSDPSKLEWVQAGLDRLAEWLDLEPWAGVDTFVTIPALGCGLGGLEWLDVRAIAEVALAKTQAQILMFEPMEVSRVAPGR